jgi:hypothetical protein
MPKNQVIYSTVGTYVGPAPSNTGHFITSSGAINNNWENINDNYPLVFPLKRVVSASYSIEVNRTNISHLGNLGTIARPILNNPEVQLNISYYLMGLINEMRLGLLGNVHWNSSAEEYLLYGDNRIPLLSGLYSRDYSPSNDSDYNYPLKSREPKNIFVAVKKDSLDLNDVSSGDSLSTKYKNTSVDVYGFGDCYINSYRSSAGIGQIPTVSVGFVSNNIELYASGLCNDIPAINPRTYNIYSGTKFSIPNNFEGDGLPTVMLPNDITLSIKQRSNNSENLTDLLLNYTDVKIQSYNFDLNLNRSPLYGVGYKFPLDKVLTTPIIGSLNFSLLPGDSKEGSIVSLIKRDEDYDISIRLNYQRGSLFNGCGICYDFISAKFNGFDSNLTISERQNNNLSFTFELDPLATTKGMFITGYLGIPNSGTSVIYLGDEFDYGGTDNLLFQNDDLFVLNMSGYKLLY